MDRGMKVIPPSDLLYNFFMVFMEGENVSLHFEKWVKGVNFNVFNINPYSVEYHW